MVLNGKAPAVLSIVCSAAALGAFVIWWSLVGAQGLSGAYHPSTLSPGQTYLNISSEIGVTHDAAITLQLEIDTWPALGANIDKPCSSIFQRGLQNVISSGSEIKLGIPS